MIILNEREKEILKYVCLESLGKSEAVASKTIARRIRFKYSSATIRNIFSSLEKKRYLYKFHLSSGRVPTDLGWRYFVDEIVFGDRDSRVKSRLKLEFQGGEELTWQTIVEGLARASGNLILFFAFLNRDLDFFYQAGISRLFSDKNLKGITEEIAKDLDNFIRFFPDWILGDIKIERWPLVLIGRECELTRSGSLSFLIDNAEFDRRRIYLLLVGPKAMAYGKNLVLLEEGIKALSDLAD